jgi:hypothetical protein
LLVIVDAAMLLRALMLRPVVDQQQAMALSAAELSVEMLEQQDAALRLLMSSELLWFRPK